MASSLEPGSEITSVSDKALEEVSSHIKEVFANVKCETVKVCKEMAAFDALAKKLKHVNFLKNVKAQCWQPVVFYSYLSGNYEERSRSVDRGCL